MPNETQPNNARQTALVLEARAGLVPASDHLADEQRARVDQIGRAVRTYAEAGRGGSDELAIIDILSDLRHYCDSTGLAFPKLNRAAREQYQEEATETGDHPI